MKLNKKHIPFYAAIVQTAQYALAGYFLIGHIGWFFVGSMGALVSLAMAYGSSQFADIAKNRKPGAMVSLVLIMLLSPIIVGTATWLHLTNIQNPIWRAVVSFAWGALPDGAVVLSGFIAGRGLVERESKPKKTAQQSLSRKSRPKSTAKQTSRAKKMSEQVACKWGCGLSGTRGAMNAHSQFCAKNPANAPVDVTKVLKG